MERDAPELSNSDWPAVDRAYDFVVPSYQILTGRFEAADTRLNNLITFLSTMLVGLPVLARTIRPDVTFNSPLFIGAFVLLVTAAIAGMSGRLSGRLILVDPSVLFRESLHESDWEFKKNALFFAGNEPRHNRSQG